MIFGQTWNLSPLSADDAEKAIMNRPTPLGEYFDTVTHDAFQSSLPGTIYENAQVPDDDRTPIATPGAGRSGITMYRPTGVPIMDEAQWKDSEFYREAIPYDGRMTEARAKIKAEIFDSDQHEQFLRQNRAWGVGTVAAAVAGSVLGSAPDPVNYVPVFGSAFKAANMTRLGVVMARAGIGAADAAVTTALEEPIIASSRRQFGDDMSFADQVMDVALGALIGGVAGGIHGRVEKISDLHPDRVSAALNALGRAAGDLAEDRPLDIGGAYRTSLLTGTSLGRAGSIDPRLLETAGGVDRAADLNQPSFTGRLETPTRRPNGEPAVYPADATGFKSEINRQIKAAEKEGRTLELRPMPDGRQELVEVSEIRWHDQYPDAKTAHAAANRIAPTERPEVVPVETAARGRGFALVTGATPTQLAAMRADPRLAERIRATATTAAPPERGIAAPAGEGFSQAMDATAPDLRQRLAPRSIDSKAVDPVTTDPVVAARAESKIGKPQRWDDAGVKERAADSGINPTSGEFEELADLKRLDAADLLSDGERDLMDIHDAEIKRTELYAQTFQAAAACLARAA